jgi:tRNA pseudouridine(38-40) synthase
LHPITIQNALNFYLCRPQIRRKGYSSATSHRNYGETDIRVLNVVPAPLQHTYYYYNYKVKGSSSTTNSSDATAPYYVDEWNARFTAIQRRYVYRILTGCKAEGLNTIFPFEWDRAWFIPSSSSSGNNNCRRELDTSLMQEAANYLIGTHDFTSFRGKNCQRASPITTISELAIHEDKNYYYSAYLGCSSSPLREDPQQQQQQQQKTNNQVRLITISVVGTSFLYRQVRNIVGCLVYVGQGRVSPMEVQRMLYAKDRKAAPPTAPAHALFLVDVEHEGLKI